MKTVFILGAGASVEAGLPVSANLPGIEGLNSRILTDARADVQFSRRWQNRREPIGQIVEWAHRQMITHSPRKQHNAETLFNILDMAAGSGTLPFSAISNRPHRTLQRAEKRYEKYRETAPSDWGGPTLLDEARKLITNGLHRWLWVDDAEKVRYLVPLLEYCKKTSSAIVSLNYDNCIELASTLCGIEVDDGISRWTQKRTLHFEPGKIPLIKLHGSLSWYESNERLNGGPKRRETIVRSDDKEKLKLKDRILIFGGTNKLTYTAPFPDLYAEFRKRINEVNEVSIIGYSGMDPHINEVIRHWGFNEDGRLLSEVTREGQIYQNIFGIGPFEYCDKAGNVRRGFRANHTLGLNVFEWLNMNKPYTGKYLEHLLHELENKVPIG